MKPNRVVRVLVYEFDSADKLEAQLGRSLNDGVRVLPQGTIRVTTFPGRLRLLSLLKLLVGR